MVKKLDVLEILVDKIHMESLHLGLTQQVRTKYGWVVLKIEPVTKTPGLTSFSFKEKKIPKK